MSEAATVVLVHGAFHGAWCWKYVAEGLRERGLAVRCFDLPGHGASPAPLGSLAEDAQAVREVLADVPGEVVLCGHSYGGVVITEAAGDQIDRLRHMVYLAAAIPDAGESLADCFPGLIEAELENGTVSASDGSGGIMPDPDRAVDRFYPDCDALIAEWAVAQLDGQDPRSFIDAASAAPWRSVESTYVICSEDLVLPPCFQQRLAKRCSRSFEWVSSHSPMLSQPDRVVGLLADLAI